MVSIKLLLAWCGDADVGWDNCLFLYINCFFNASNRIGNQSCFNNVNRQNTSSGLNKHERALSMLVSH